jgi:hypothetical protein
MYFSEGFLGNNLVMVTGINDKTDVIYVISQSAKIGVDDWATVVSNLNTSIASKSPKFTTNSTLSIKTLTLFWGFNNRRYFHFNKSISFEAEYYQ